MHRVSALFGVIMLAHVAGGCGGRTTGQPDGDPPATDDGAPRLFRFALLVKRDAVGLTRYVNKISDPTHEQHAKFLSGVEEVEARFGASAATRKTVNDFFTKHDATDVKWSVTGGYVFASLPGGKLVDLFCADPFFEKSGDIEPGCIPSTLLCAVEGITPVPGTPTKAFGVDAPVDLDTKPLANIDKPGAGGVPKGCAQAIAQLTGGGMTPNEIRKGFGFDAVVSPKDNKTPLYGKGRFIVTVNKSPLKATVHAKNAECYRVKEWITPLKLGAYKSNALNTGDNDTGTDNEPDIDTSLAMLMAPAARIQQVVSESGGDGVQAMLFEAVLDKNLIGGVPDVVSSSLGPSPHSFTSAGLGMVEFALAAGSAIGITYVGAAGDQGFSDGQRPYPAVSRFAIGVGGVNATYTTKNAIAELAVMYIPGSDIGGGGPSSLFARPSWQKGPSSVFGPGLTFEEQPMRLTPDVAMTGAPQVPLYSELSPITFAAATGTSSATPIFAAAVALANEARAEMGKKPLGRMGPLLYQLASTHYEEMFTDVTKGTGGGKTLDTGKAVPGYDMATGLGTIKVAEFVKQLVEAP